MIKAICFHCGAGKEGTMSACTHCGQRPTEGSDQALSEYLSVRYLSPGDLGEASSRIQAARTISPSARFQALLPLRRDAERLLARQRRRRRLALMGAVWVLFLVAFGLLHSWPRYAWARMLDSESSYASYSERFPHSGWTAEAKRHLQRVREPTRWSAASGSKDLLRLRAFLADYPSSQHAASARAEIAELAIEEWESVQHSESQEELKQFLADFADQGVTTKAKARLAELKRAQAIKDMLASGNPRAIAQFIQANPNSIHLAEARASMEKLGEKRWKLLSTSTSETELNEFKRLFSGTRWAGEADKRILALYSDLAWLIRRNSLSAYRRHLELFPDSPHRAEIEDRIIRLEAAGIAATSSGTLPSATPLSQGVSGVNVAEVSIENQTGHQLTVWYTGPSARKVVLPVGGKQTVELNPGFYTVAASVAGVGVRNYSGEDTLVPARYSVAFAIRQEQVPGYQPLRDFRR